MASTSLPSRSNTTSSRRSVDEDAVPTGDPSDTTNLLTERLQAWKHMCGYLEDYISEAAKMQKSQAKDQEKILKTLSHPLKEGHHFDQSVGGISSLFENLRVNTQAQSDLNIETSKQLTSSVLPILERLHSEIKNKTKELSHGAGKGSKAVDSARNTSQKQIEALGQYTASFDSTGGKVSASNDPYVLQRGVYYRLNKQMLEENNNSQDLIAVQNSFQQFEAHVIQTVQTALNSYNQHMSGQLDRQKAMFGDMASTAGKIPYDFEWNGFMRRNGSVLINPNTPPRTMENVHFPNQNHRATRALIEGSLERKRGGLGALKGYSTGYCVVTPAGYLHEFENNENYHKDPTPELSLYLPDCTIGAVDGNKFTIKGKDSSGSKIGQKISMTSEFSFKAHTITDAEQWHSIIAQQTTGPAGSPTVSSPESRNITPITTQTEQQPHQQGMIGGTESSGPQSAGVHSTSPLNAGPQSSTSPTGMKTSPIIGQAEPTPNRKRVSFTSSTNPAPQSLRTDRPANVDYDEIQPKGQGKHFRH